MSIVGENDRCGLFVRAADLFGQAPVEHDRFAVVAQDDVLRLQVAVNDAARVRVGQRLAHIHEDIQQPRQRQLVFVAGSQLLVLPTERLRERFALDQLHRVERPAAAIHFVDRHDVGMLQLPSDLRLFDQPPHRLRRGRAGLHFLERDLAREFVVPRQPDFAEAPFADFTDPGVARLGLFWLTERFANRFDQHRPARRPRTERLLHLGIIHFLQQRFTNITTCRCIECHSRIVLVLRQLALGFFVNERSIISRDPASLDQQVSERLRLVTRPGTTRRCELL